MKYKCNKCIDPNLSDCFNVNCKKVAIKPKKVDYTHDYIFDKYLNDKCPVCLTYINSENETGYTNIQGKCVSKYFECNSCNSQYTVGFNRSLHPILSEINYNGLYPENN